MPITIKNFKIKVNGSATVVVLVITIILVPLVTSCATPKACGYMHHYNKDIR